MNSKPFGDPNLKSCGLDGTWLPKGHFGETDFTCPSGHKLIHHDLVRGPHIIPLKKGTKYTLDMHPKLSNNYRILKVGGKTVSVRHDCISYDYDDVVQYTTDPVTGKVVMTCPIDGATLMTYEPHPGFKNFEGELHTVIDGEKI